MPAGLRKDDEAFAELKLRIDNILLTTLSGSSTPSFSLVYLTKLWEHWVLECDSLLQQGSSEEQSLSSSEEYRDIFNSEQHQRQAEKRNMYVESYTGLEAT
jgi:hypothetical protein